MTQKDYQQEWRKNNRQWILDYREKNKEKIRKQSRERYLRNKEHNDVIRKKWYEKNKVRIIIKLRHKKETLSGKTYQWKMGAKRRGIAWTLTPEFISSLPLVCHYTGLPLVLEVGHINTLSLDRVDSSKPYEPNNVVPCCSMINDMKYDYTTEEFIEMCRRVVSHQPQ